MAQLQTHDLPDLVAINTTSGVQGGRPWTMHNTVMPGEPVHHKSDPKSYGMVLSRRWGPNDKPMQCEVLWSKEPTLVQVQVQPIQSQSRKLRATWTAEEAVPQIYGMGAIKTFQPRERYEVEEEYENLSYDEVQRFHEQGADVRLHSNGHVTVKRRTDEEPGPDDRVMRRTFRSR